jgi:hypothetical protein
MPAQRIAIASASHASATASIISWSPDLHRWGIFFPDSLILASSLKEVAHEWTGDQCRELLKKLQVPQGGVV